ncbi:MAG: sulfur carrier protein ThiS [Candidatus Manganitrophaceae bacterium]
MQVIVNGTRQEVPSEVTLSQLLAGLKVQPERVAVEVNLKVIQRQQYDQVSLKEGDVIEMIGFVGGGSSCREFIS